MGRETDIWPLVPAKYFGKTPDGQRRAVKFIVIHDMEYPETAQAAEDIAVYFRDMPDDRQVSAHVCVDSDSIVQCVPDNDIAYGAPGVNASAIHIELSGFQRQSRAEWLDPYGQKLITNAANVTAQYCMKYMITPLHITDGQLKMGVPGIVGHDQVSRVFKQSDHTDPGPNFPWDVFMQQVGPLYVARLNRPKEVTG